MHGVWRVTSSDGGEQMGWEMRVRRLARSDVEFEVEVEAGLSSPVSSHDNMSVTGVWGLLRDW